MLPSMAEPGWDVPRNLGFCMYSYVSFRLCEMAEMSVLLTAELF